MSRTTLGALLAASATERPHAPAVVVDGEDPLTYAQLHHEAQRVATTLTARHPQARHVALLMPNSTRWVVGLYGAALAGRTAVLLNPRLRDAELVYQIDQSDTDVLVAADPPGRRLGTLFDALAAESVTPPVIWGGPGTAPTGTPWAEWLADGDAIPPGAEPDDTAVIIYTSGTTALPKGVMLSHAAVTGNAAAVARRFGAGPADRVFSAGPFFHSGGLTMHVVLSAVVGAAAHSVPAFDPARVVELVERDRITIYNGIETLFLRLATAAGFAPERLSSVRTGWTTGTPSILTTIADEVGIPGVIGVYGISEAAPNVTMSDHTDDRNHRLGTIGRPQDDTELRVVDPASGEPVATGAVGELLVRGPGLMTGYYAKPEETAEALRGGWLHTGDLVRARPDGYYEFAGRSKDIVRVGGENVSCAEVENAIYALGGVALAAVVGVDDPDDGEVAVAAVTLHAGIDAFNEQGMLERLRASLAGYKVPRRVVHLDTLPLTESGKVQKAMLRERLAEIEVP